MSRWTGFAMRRDRSGHGPPLAWSRSTGPLDGGVQGRVIRNPKPDVDALIREHARRPRSYDVEVLPADVARHLASAVGVRSNEEE
jgi:hypothetical protein